MASVWDPINGEMESEYLEFVDQSIYNGEL